MSRLTSLLAHGALDDVAALVDANELTNGELRSVILNLIGHIEGIERRLASRRAGEPLGPPLPNPAERYD